MVGFNISTYWCCQQNDASNCYCQFEMCWLCIPMQGRIPVLGEYGGLGCAIDGHLWSHTAWGYGDKEVNRDVEVLAVGLEKLLGRLAQAICMGVGAAIYTQWNDVETEVNGLLTYDRHMKLPLEFFQEFSARVMAAFQHCGPTEGQSLSKGLSLQGGRMKEWAAH
ncbi:unnamed protein product [Effrenium voratum]|nr:unnamed protein product [Effrenium voratum]